MESGPEFMTFALKLDASPGWHKTMTKILGSVQDVSYTIDATQGLAYVSGKIDLELLMTLLAKSEKYVQPRWIRYGGSEANNGHLHDLTRGETTPVAHYSLPAPTTTDQKSPRAPVLGAPPLVTYNKLHKERKPDNCSCCLM